MVSNKSKILIGGGALVILLICIVLILVMTKSSNTSTNSGSCPNGKSKIICSDNTSQCPDDCPVTCPPKQTLVNCSNGTSQCAPSCDNIGLSWICKDKDMMGSCQSSTGGTGGTGGPVLPDGTCPSGEIKIGCGDGTSQCASCAPNRKWNCKTKKCEEHGCCGTSVWDDTLGACKNIIDPTKYNIKCINGGTDGKVIKVPNSDKTLCINECRLDGLLAEEQCYEEIPDSSIYFDSVPSSLANQRTFCYKTIPDQADSDQLCYHYDFDQKYCDATGNDDISSQLNRMKDKGYIQGQGGCNTLVPSRDDCFMYMINNKVSGSNFLTNPKYPVYLYLKDDNGKDGFFKQGDQSYRIGFDKKPIQCWNTENPPTYSQFGCSNNDKDNLSHVFPPKEDKKYFCDNVLETIVSK